MERLILEALRVLLRAQLEQVVSDEVREALLAQIAAIRDALAVWSAIGSEGPPKGYSEDHFHGFQILSKDPEVVRAFARLTGVEPSSQVIYTKQNQESDRLVVEEALRQALSDDGFVLDNSESQGEPPPGVPIG